MIVSRKYDFVIACPTKTGTNTMRALVESWLRKGGSPSVLTLLTGEKRTRHRVAPPTGRETSTRYILTRDDRSRLVSMYEYLRRKEWEWSAKDILHNEAHYGREEAWIRFLRVIAATRQSKNYFAGGRRHVHGSRPYMWTDLMEELVSYMDGYDVDGSHLPWYGTSVLPSQDTRRLDLATLEDDWKGLLADLEVEEDELWDLTIPHRNASPVEDRLFSSSAAYWEVDGASALLGEITLAQELKEAGER